MYRVVFSIFSICFVVFCDVCFCQSAQRIAGSLSASTVILELEGRGVGFHGSGFFIGEGLVATNAHVVDGASSGVVRVVNQPRPFVIGCLVACV